MTITLTAVEREAKAYDDTILRVDREKRRESFRALVDKYGIDFVRTAAGLKDKTAKQYYSSAFAVVGYESLKKAEYVLNKLG